MIEIFLLGILTGLVVALLAIYSYSRITAGGAEAASEDALTAAIIKEQAKLLGQALRRRSRRSSRSSSRSRSPRGYRRPSRLRRRSASRLRQN